MLFLYLKVSLALTLIHSSVPILATLIAFFVLVYKF